MSTKFTLGAILAVGTLSLASVFGCVADRPSRNGVFNENQYLRKAFIVRPGDATNADNGWMLKATVVTASEPNVFGDDAIFGLFSGAGSFGDLIHFVVTSDRMQMVSNRAISADPSVGIEQPVVNAWPITNVDLKYRINLDGEKTNYFEENQEADWAQRQWVKVNIDKNDMSDLAPLGAYYNASIATCADTVNASATLVPGSFFVDEPNDYMEWTVQVTLPIKYTADCVAAFGPAGAAAARLGREYETVSLKYSMVRAVATPTYQPLTIGEKDPILKKYGPITFNTIARDPTTGLLGANTFVTRHDPAKPIDWYFENGFPANYLPYFTSNTKVLPSGTMPINGIITIEDATNQLLKDSGANARVAFHMYNEPIVNKDGSTTAINRQFGDVRFNMMRWLESEDQQSTFAGATGGVIDPRTGEILSSNIVFENFAIKDLYVARIDAYLQAVGASPGSPFAATDWPAPVDATGAPVSCAAASDVGKSVPIIPTTTFPTGDPNGKPVFLKDVNSTLFAKMQGYLYKPIAQYGPLGPQDFIMKHTDPMDPTKPDQDFFNAYFGYIPYVVFADPATNAFVTPESGSANTAGGMSAQMWQMIHQEAQLHDLEAKIDKGWLPFDVNGPTGEGDAVNFMAQYKQLTLNHHALQYAKQEMPNILQSMSRADTPDSFAMISAIQRDARHCVQDSTGIHWESKTDWINNLITTYWTQVFWHEFGHSMGLDHNFMASVDLPNFPKPAAGAPTTNADGTARYSLYASSVMEYNAAVDRIFWTPNWAPYDQGAISWIYANQNCSPTCAGQPVPMKPGAPPMSIGVSGQQSPTYPWIDPHGYNGMTETQFLFCDARHTKETPLCRAGDIGITPSEITANELDAYEWQYKWRNFRQYRKFWDDSTYGDIPMNTVTELRRFLSLWSFDMSANELTQRFQQIGIPAGGLPSSAPSAQYYYDQLTRKFNDEMAHAGVLSAAYHEAIVQQSSGSRPFATIYDNYFGDVTQQGIFLDKLDAIQGFSALWPVDNYDLTQSAGTYITSFSQYGTTFYADQTAIGSLYATVAEQALESMLGGAFDAFYYAKPLAVAQFTFDTHTPQYLGSNASPARAEAQDWAGGHAFYREQDFLDFFREIAVTNNFQAIIPGGVNIDCGVGKTIADCNYDPRTPRGYPSDTFYSDAYNRFLGPDGRRWVWVWLADRNEWLAADQDRNTATYVSMYNYTTDVIFGHDDGNIGNAYGLALQLKYMFDYYEQALAIKP